MTRGSICIVSPADDRDPQAQEWAGCEVLVIAKLVRAHTLRDYVRVMDTATGQVAVLAADDLKEKHER